MADFPVHKIFEINASSAEDLAIEIFQFQYRHNELYRSFTDAIGRRPATVRSWEDIPYLPIRFFKSHRLLTGGQTAEAEFRSSGTTGQAWSTHWVRDLSLYESSFFRGFERVYGSPEKWCILGLLPSYLERGHSSLVYMVRRLMEKSGHPLGGFFLQEPDRLRQRLLELEAAGQPVLLIGVTYALLDFAERGPLPLKHTVVMETGGMKGRREEWVRDQVHQRLCGAFGLSKIHSEYGMTELLSQAYSTGDGIFSAPPWMRVLLRDEEDPFTLRRSGRGVLNLADLANVYSVAFLATDDAGRLEEDGRFEVLGRVDGSDLRGCSLLTV